MAVVGPMPLSVRGSDIKRRQRQGTFYSRLSFKCNLVACKAHNLEVMGLNIFRRKRGIYLLKRWCDFLFFN